MRAMLLLAAMACGCANQATPEPVIGPSPVSQEAALGIVWEGVYGMERESRPTSITWWKADGCGEEQSFAGTIEGLCASDSEGGNGDIYMRWEGSISASTFSRALVMWRQYLMTGAMTRPSPVDIELVNAANDMLLAQHL